MLKKFVLGGMVVVAALLGNACGDDGSSDSPAGPADSEVTLSSSSDDVVLGSSSSSSVTESPLTSSGQAPQSAELDGSSSSEKAVGGSSSSDGKASSSSGKVESSSSGKGEKSSSSSKDLDKSSSSIKNEGSSSSTKTDESSSSKKTDESSSSDKPVESSSSMAKSSSSEISSSSVKLAESSSSEMSSSSIKPEESSSSEMSSSSGSESSSSVASSSSESKSSSSVASSSSLNSAYDSVNNTLIDLRDGQVYKTVTIGARIWMSENLNYLPNDTVGTIWAGKTLCGGGAWKTKTEGDCETFGRLYEEDFASIKNYTQAICPDGWSLPTKAQYQEFISSLGDDAANKMRIDNSVYWDVNDVTNQSGFSAVPSGYYSAAKGFNPIYEQETPVVALFFDRKSQTGNSTIMIVDNEINYMQFGDKQFAAIRCIKN